LKSSFDDWEVEKSSLLEKITKNDSVVTQLQEELELANMKAAKLSENEILLQKIEHSKQVLVQDVIELREERERLTSQLTNEKLARLHDKTNHAMEISQISDVSEVERERLANELVRSNETCEELEKDLLSVNQKNKELQDSHVSVILSLKASLKEKIENVQELQSLLTKSKKKISSANTEYQTLKSSKSHSEQQSALKIEELCDQINLNKDEINFKNDEISSLKEDIARLYQSMKDEIESKLAAEKALSKKLKESKKEKSDIDKEKEAMTLQVSSLTIQLESTRQELSIETEEKEKSANNAKTFDETLRKLQSDKAQLSHELQSKKIEFKEISARLDLEKSEREGATSTIVAMERAIEKKMIDLQGVIEVKNSELDQSSQKLLSIMTSNTQKDTVITNLESYTSSLKENLAIELKRVAEINTAYKSLQEENSTLSDEMNAAKEQIFRMKEIETIEIKKMKNSLESKSAKNDKLKELLNSARAGNQETAKAIQAELVQSKETNVNLAESLRHKTEELETRVNEIEEKDLDVKELSKKYDDISARISDLSIINESLQSESAALREGILKEKNQKDRMYKKNKALKSTMRVNEEQMRTQMKELEATMKSTLTKIESKHSRIVEEEKSSSKLTVTNLQSEIESYLLKISRLEAAVQELQHQASRAGNINSADRRRKASTQEEVESIRNENSRLRKRLQSIEDKQFSLRWRSTNIGDGADGVDGNQSHTVEWRIEKDRRIKAEEFAAAMAARAKAGFEEKNEEIVKLRLRVSNLELEKENISTNRNLLLTNESLYRSDGDNITNLALQERDEAMEEARRYRSIARKLNDQVMAMNQQMIEGEQNVENRMLDGAPHHTRFGL